MMLFGKQQLMLQEKESGVNLPMRVVKQKIVINLCKEMGKNETNCLIIAFLMEEKHDL